jgi:hypothetical protein
MAAGLQAAKWLVAKKSAAEVKETLVEMSLTIEANIPAILRHNAVDTANSGDTAAIGEQDIRRATEEMRRVAAMPARFGCNVAMPSPTAGQAITYDDVDPVAVVATLATAVKAGNAAMLKSRPSTMDTNCYLVDLIRRRLQQLGWNHHIIAILPPDEQ